MEAGSHTFLFADLVGFTALAELEGDARALEVVLGMQERVRRLLREHGAEDRDRAAVGRAVRLCLEMS